MMVDQHGLKLIYGGKALAALWLPCDCCCPRHDAPRRCGECTLLGARQRVIAERCKFMTAPGWKGVLRNYLLQGIKPTLRFGVQGAIQGSWQYDARPNSRRSSSTTPRHGGMKAVGETYLSH